MKIKVLTLIILVSAGSAFSQDLESLLNRDLDSEQRTIVAQSISIPSGKETDFWKLYSDMEVELDKISLNRVANIKKFANKYDNISEKEASGLVSEFIELNIKRQKTYSKYYNKLSKIISDREAARLIQILSQVQGINDVKKLAEVSLIE